MKWPIMIRRVQGDSMVPALRAGTIVLGWRWFDSLEPSDIVIVRHNGLEKIKRVQQVRKDQVFVVGDNRADSTDSRSFGWLDKTAVRARVLHR